MTWLSRLGTGRFLAALLCVSLGIGVLTACGGSPSATESPASLGATSAAPDGVVAPAAPADFSSRGAAASSVPKGGAPVVGSGKVGESAQASSLPAPGQPRMLVKTGTLGLVVKDVDSSFGRISAIARQYGGDVLQYTNSKTGERRVADVTLQVDSAQFEAAMTALRELPDVVERRVDKAEATDVTEEFADVKAQITNLEATERQLRDIMAKATRTEDILNIQREITNVRGQIERLQGRANYLDRRATLSTIALHLEMPVAVTVEPPLAAWRFTATVIKAWNASLQLLQAVATVVISAVVFCWWLLPLGVLAVFGRRAWRRRGRANTIAASVGD